ncbi:MAG TPA: TIGR03546 family protein [Gemmatimonadales bacterium]|nr:TIGR03546 family protein [Gemmatimonadales bacterium]
MLFLKLIQQLVGALNSDGTPRQVAAGIALGAVFGLTPLMNLHNLVLFGLALILNISMAGVFLGWAVFVPVGFALDPLFDAIGKALLGADALRPLWTSLYNVPVVPFTNFNNSVVLGSFVFWLVSLVPFYFLWKWAVTRYRETVFERLKKLRIFQLVAASKLYTTYRSLSRFVP